jgi:protein-tyrosine phosphatase
MNTANEVRSHVRATGLNRRRLLGAAGATGLGLLLAPGLTDAASAHRPRPTPKPTIDPKTRFRDVQGAMNVRDIGGYTTTGGETVKWGTAIRGGNLVRLTDLGVSQFAALGVKAVVDMRSLRELGINGPDRVPTGVGVLQAPVGDTPPSAPPAPPGATADPAILAEFQSYVTAAEPQAAFGAALRRVAAGGRPFYFHCSSGTYRTGWAVAVLMTALRVERSQVYDEFLLSNLWFGAQYAWPDYLDAAFAQATQSFGSFERYLRKGLGVNDDTVESLRESLLTGS